MDGVAQPDEGLAGDSWLSPAGTGRRGCELRDPGAAGQGDEAGEGRGPVRAAVSARGRRFSLSWWPTRSLAWTFCGCGRGTEE